MDFPSFVKEEPQQASVAYNMSAGEASSAQLPTVATVVTTSEPLLELGAESTIVSELAVEPQSATSTSLVVLTATDGATNVVAGGEGLAAGPSASDKGTGAVVSNSTQSTNVVVLPVTDVAMEPVPQASGEPAPVASEPVPIVTIELAPGLTLGGVRETDTRAPPAAEPAFVPPLVVPVISTPMQVDEPAPTGLVVSSAAQPGTSVVAVSSAGGTNTPAEKQEERETIVPDAGTEPEMILPDLQSESVPQPQSQSAPAANERTEKGTESTPAGINPAKGQTEAEPEESEPGPSRSEPEPKRSKENPNRAEPEPGHSEPGPSQSALEREPQLILRRVKQMRTRQSEPATPPAEPAPAPAEESTPESGDQHCLVCNDPVEVVGMSSPSGSNCGLHLADYLENAHIRIEDKLGSIINNDYRLYLHSEVVCDRCHHTLCQIHDLEVSPITGERGAGWGGGWVR